MDDASVAIVSAVGVDGVLVVMVPPVHLLALCLDYGVVGVWPVRLKVAAGVLKSTDTAVQMIPAGLFSLVACRVHGHVTMVLMKLNHDAPFGEIFHWDAVGFASFGGGSTMTTRCAMTRHDIVTTRYHDLI